MVNGEKTQYVVPIWRTVHKKGKRFKIILNDEMFPKPSDYDRKIGEELKQALSKSEIRNNALIQDLLLEYKAAEAPFRIALTDILTDQINRIGEFTDVTKLEFGALIVKDSRGVKLDFLQIGESRSVEIKPTRKLYPDEWIIGSYHQHPITDKFSIADILSFLTNSWEKIMILRGAHETIHIALKTNETKTVTQMDKECDKLDNKEVAEKCGFLLYVGTDSNNLQLKNTDVKSDIDKTTNLEKIVKYIEGTKAANFEVKKIRH